jgi:hypothetical protein
MITYQGPPNIRFFKSAGTDVVSTIGTSTTWPHSRSFTIGSLGEERIALSMRIWPDGPPPANDGWVQITNTDGGTQQHKGQPYYMKIGTDGVAFMRSDGLDGGGDVIEYGGARALQNAAYNFTVWGETV